MVEIGGMLLLLSHLSSLTVETLAFTAVSRIVSLSLMGLGMALLRERLGSDEFAHIAGQHGFAPVTNPSLSFPRVDTGRTPKLSKARGTTFSLFKLFLIV